jgi:hypothetical protein
MSGTNLIQKKDNYDIKDDFTIVRSYEEIGGIIRKGPKATRIVIRDYDTEKILHDTHNKILISASQFTACDQFGLDTSVIFPSYNEELGLQNTLDYKTVQPMNRPIVCLFCAGQGGCGTVASDVYTVKFTDRLAPKDMLPFRYVDEKNDLSDELRKVYFGRYKDSNGMIRYMFKAFDTDPQLHLRYIDGTQITSDMWSIDSTQAAECYVEVKLDIDRTDFRDYFEKVTGWDNAIINSLSLVYGWYDNTIDKYLWYQQLLPYSKLNIPNEYLIDETKRLAISYEIYY